MKLMKRNHRLNVYLLALGAFLVGTAELVIAGILHIIADDLRISVGLAGQLVTAYSLAFALGTPVLVSLTSRWGRKELLIGSLALFVLGCLASCLSSDFSVLLASRLLLGLSAGVFTVTALSSVVKLVPADQMGSAIGTIALGFGTAMALGVSLGTAIAEMWSWQAIFAVLGLASLAVILILIRLLPQIEGDAPLPFRRQLRVLGNPVIMSGLLISLLICASNSIMLTYLAPFLQTILHLDTAAIGIMMLVLGMAGIIGSRFGGFGVDKWGTVRMIAASLSAAAAALACLPLLTASWIAGALLLIIWMASVFMNAPALNAYFIQQAPQSSNFVLSINTSIIHLGLAAGAGVGGVVVNAVSTVWYNPWLAGAAVVLGLLAAVVSFSMLKRRAAAQTGE
jgi:DHA1 family putative efflux transporter-like MFS transporter